MPVPRATHSYPVTRHFPNGNALEKHRGYRFQCHIRAEHACAFGALTTALAAAIGTGNIVGVIVVALAAVVILGGIKSISKVREKLVPVMAIFFVACCLAIIAMNGQYLGEAIRQITVGAFTPAGAVGGADTATAPSATCWARRPSCRTASCFCCSCSGAA